MSYHPAADEVHVDVRDPVAAPPTGRAGWRCGGRVRDDARRRAAGCRRLRARPVSAPAPPRSSASPYGAPHAATWAGRGRRLLRPQGLCLRRPGRARQVLVRRRVRPRRARGRGRLRHRRVGDRRRTGATAASGSGASRTTASPPGPRRSAGIRRSPASRPATSASTGAAAWFRQGAFLLNTDRLLGDGDGRAGVRRRVRRRPVRPAADRAWRTAAGAGGRVLPRAR